MFNLLSTKKMANLNNAQSAKTAQMAAVVMGTGKEVANKHEEAKQLILLPTAAEAVTTDKVETKKGKASKNAKKVEATEKKVEATTKATTKPVAESVKAEEVKTAKPRKMSIDELTDKAERVYLLQVKYAEIRDKRKQLQNFTIKHEEDTAQLTLVDAKGMSIVTHNPTAIKHLLDDWMADINQHLTSVETQLRQELEQMA